jgi:hypothetical protein
MMDDELRRAFEETHFIVHHRPAFTLRIGQSSSDLDALLRRTGHDCAVFITAWNPMCRSLSDSDNDDRQQALLCELHFRKLRWVPGIGKHPTNGWPGEASLLVLGVQRSDAEDLVKMFEQMACLFCLEGEPVQLIEHPS